MEYNLRGVPRTDYKDLADVKLPRARPKTVEAKLYPVDIVEGRGWGESTLHWLSLVLRPAMLYQGGLKSLGYLKKRERGHEVYGIKAYKDLIPLFGENWHIRIKNKQLDFCYASLETTEFYIRKRAPVQEFTLSGEAITSVRGGHVHTFKFVRMDGVRRHLDYVRNIQ